MASAIVKTTCEQCGDVDLTPRDIELILSEDGWAWVYRFTCPICHQVVDRPAQDERVVTLLISAGVRVVDAEQPGELEEIHTGPAFTSDDLIDFHQALQSDDWFERLQSTPARS